MHKTMNRGFIYLAVSPHMPAFFITLGFGLASPVLPLHAHALVNFIVHLRFATRTVLIPLFGNNVLDLTFGEIGLVLSASTFANLLMVVPGGFYR